MTINLAKSYCFWNFEIDFIKDYVAQVDRVDVKKLFRDNTVFSMTSLQVIPWTFNNYVLATNL
jgi:hypothetical protein